jgi:DNA-binding NarL/FixJ family response regulator
MFQSQKAGAIAPLRHTSRAAAASRRPWLALACGGSRAARGAGRQHQRALVARTRPAAPLTAREWEVAVLIAQGHTNRQIAERLIIAPRTADNHVQHIFDKLGLSARAQVAAWVAMRGAPLHA